MSRDQAIYAHWSVNNYTLTFEGEDGSELTTITQNYESVVEFPVPEKTGYSVDYWCTDPELTKRYDGTTMPAEDLTLYPKWRINIYVLVFVFENGTTLNMTLAYNEEIHYPDAPSRVGYTFGGWDNEPVSIPCGEHQRHCTVGLHPICLVPIAITIGLTR